MAPEKPILFLIFSLLISISSPVLCRKIATTTGGKAPITATLDVAAALEKTAQVLSSDPLLAQESLLHRRQHPAAATTTASSRPTFSLPLHPRASLRRPAHADYKSLTLARLARDDARVRALSTRVQLAVQGVRKADLVPLAEDDGGSAALEATAAAADGIRGPVVSGTSQGSGEYFSRVGVGRPAREMFMVLDTGSDVTWVQCQPCTDCYQQADSIFDPSASSSYSPVPCGSSLCRSLDVSSCRNNSSCLYQVSYGDGSFTVGDFATDTLSFGSAAVGGSGSNDFNASSAAAASVPNIAFGCGHDNEGLFVGAAGLLGLGGGALSFPSQVSATSFSYCLVDRDSSAASTLEFGAARDPAAVTAPLLRNRKADTFYYVGLSGISVGGELLSIPPSSFAAGESGEGGVIVDSGTAVTRLQSDAYASLRDAFVRGTAGLPSAGAVALFDTCYDLSGRDTVEVPAVSFHFPGEKALRLPAKNYLIPVDSAGTFCLAFAPTTTPLSIIGNVQQQGTRVGFDLANSLASFSPNRC